MFDKNYYIKIGSIMVAIFGILLFIKSLTFVNSLLLSLIIVVSIMIIDNLPIYNKVDCTSCSVEKFENIPNINEPIFTNVNKNEFTKLNESEIKNFDYMNSYVNYQKNGMEEKDAIDSLNKNIFKLSIADQSLIKPYLIDSYNFYKGIKNRGVNVPEPDEMVKANLEYGNEYNYLGPLNFGMANREYSLIMPNNWSPVQGMQMVAPIDRKRKSIVYPTMPTTNYGTWASIEEFDRASRFTGGQNINIEYLKNVCNNAEIG